MRYAKGAEKWDMVPNIDFWKAVPGLIKVHLFVVHKRYSITVCVTLLKHVFFSFRTALYL